MPKRESAKIIEDFTSVEILQQQKMHLRGRMVTIRCVRAYVIVSPQGADSKSFKTESVKKCALHRGVILVDGLYTCSWLFTQL